MAHFWPEKDGEWYTVRRGTARFPGHDMPRIPLLGYQDEADPAIMKEHVELARKHGINVFIMDWYWYENTPCFERQLNDALIPALDGTDSKFYLMWANHDVNNLWDMHTDTAYGKESVVMTGQVDRDVLESMFDRLIERYFTLDSYYCIDGKPVFSVFMFPILAAGLGGIQETADAFAWMRQRCTEKGLPGLHIQTLAGMGGGVKPGTDVKDSDECKIAKALGFDSATSYQCTIEGGYEGDYVIWADKALACWNPYEEIYGTYYPHVAVGWDNTQRNPPIRTAVTGSTPDAFEACLWRARHFLDARPEMQQLVTLNSWNEWTEGSYLLPDMRWGYRYLEAVGRVFAGLP